MVDGCIAWQRDGLARPRSVIDATDEYFAEQDVLAQWAADRCERGAGFGESNPALFASWRRFALEQGEEPRNVKWLGSMLEHHGFARDKDCGLFRGRGFRGIRVRRGPPEPPADGSPQGNS
jgi:putative DNA primase/helicase